MRIGTSADKLAEEITKWLREDITRLGNEVVEGIDDFVAYRERVAEVRALQRVFGELPHMIQRAIDK